MKAYHPKGVLADIECPSVSGSASSNNICPNDCIDLTADATTILESTSYSVSTSIDYDPFPYVGITTVFDSAGDDEWSEVIDLPFEFCFYTNTYNQFVIGSNGLISFDLSYANTSCDATVNAPLLGDNQALDAIAGAYTDLDPSAGGTIYMDTYGVNPCRAVVISFNDIPVKNCQGATATFQMVLYERTNLIQVYSASKPVCSAVNGGATLQGVQNSQGNAAVVTPGRAYPDVWAGTNDAVEFKPLGASLVDITWYANSTPIGNGEILMNVCPTGNTTYLVAATYRDCNGDESFTISSIPIIVTVSSTAVPTLSNIPADITVSCTEALPILPLTDCSTNDAICATDDCVDNLNVSFNETSTQTNNGSSSDNCYQITRIWTAIDGDNNQTVESQIITVEDTIAPEIFGIPEDITLYCVSNPPSPAGINCNGSGICATDNCDNDVQIEYFEANTQTEIGACSDNNFVIIRTWKAIDNCGNVTEASQTITMKCECCGNGLDDDDDGLIDGADPECPCSNTILDTSCDTLSYYYIPPVWQMSRNSANQPSSLIITSPHPITNITVRNGDNSFSQSYVVTQGIPRIIDLNINQLQTTNVNTPELSKGFIIESDQLIQVFYRIDGVFNKILVTIKGENALGQAFRTGSQTNLCNHGPVWIDENHFISVMAVADNTTVNFEFSTTMWGITGSNHSVVLNAGETYLVKDNNQNKTITGSLVTSDKPIAVVSGSQHTKVCGQGRDGGVDQIVPTCLTSTDYVVVRSRGPNSQNYAAVVAIDNNTQVYKNGNYVTTLMNAGDYVEVSIGGTVGTPTSIVANKSVYVYHFSGITLWNTEIGMAVAAPIGNCSGDTYTAFPKFSDGGYHAAYVIVPNSGLNSLQLNGTPYNTFTNAQVVPGLTNYSAVWFANGDLNNNNVITCDDNFHAALLVGVNGRAGTIGYITSFKDKITTIDPYDNQPTTSYFVDSLVCKGEIVSHCVDAVSCSENFTILDIIEGPLTQTVSSVGGTCFEYLAQDEVEGEDDITIIIQNDMGLQRAICLSFYVCTKSPELFNVPLDITVQCDNIPTTNGVNVTTTAECGENPTVNFSEEITGGCPYLIIRTWSSVDDCGNVAEMSQVITVEDNEAPIINNFPADTTVECNAVPLIPNLDITDNCPNILDVDVEEINISGLCEGYYRLKRIWTITDLCGNQVVDTMNLEVNNCDPTLIENTNFNQTKCQGETAVFEVVVEEGIYTNPVYSWQFSNDNGLTWTLVAGQNLPVLNITNVQPTNAGQYQLVVSSDFDPTLNPECDTVSRALGLVVLDESLPFNNVAAICPGGYVQVGNSIYTEPGVYTDIFETDSGCDSIVNTSLTMGEIYDEYIEVFICEGEEHVVGTNTYATSGIYRDTLASITGCDSVVTTTLIVESVEDEVIVATVCGDEVFYYLGNTYTETGVYQEDWLTEGGCLYSITINLTIAGSNLDPTDTTDIAICSGETILIGNSYYDSEGIYTDTFPNQFGCDSVVITSITVDPLFEVTNVVNICEGEEHSMNPNLTEDLEELYNVYHQTGIYRDTFETLQGCDSVIITDLTVHGDSIHNHNLVLCFGEVYESSGGQIYDTNGVYTDSLQSQFGCDSIVVTNLFIEEEIKITLNQEICEGDTISIGTNNYTIAGSYTDTLVAENSCDSIVDLVLVIMPDIELELEGGEICNGDSLTLFANNDEVTWSPSEGLSCTDCPSPIAFPSVTTVYTATVEACQGTITESVEVVVMDKPTLEVSNDVIIIYGESTNLIAVATPIAYNYKWYDDENNLICANCDEITVNPTRTTSYTVVVTNADGCISMAEVVVTVMLDCSVGDLVIPNIITPNGDGRNDQLEIRFNNLSDVDFIRIYNRWGELIFETYDMGQYWDGTFRGKLLNPGVYTYYVKGYCLDGEEFIRTGNVTLLD